MTTLCIVQARMSSSRLPGKVLANMGDISVLDLLLERISTSKTVDRIVVATTTEPADDILLGHLVESGRSAFRGAALDVLERFKACAEEVIGVTKIVRITADCPFVDGSLIDELVLKMDAEKLDYCSNRLPPPYSRTYPVGLDVEVFTKSALERANTHARLNFEREHVTPYMYNPIHGLKFSIKNLEDDYSNIRLTIDDQDDLNFCRVIYSKMKTKNVSWQEIVKIAETCNRSFDSEKQKTLFTTDDRWTAS